MLHRAAALSVSGVLLLLATAAPGRCFEVFCVANNDGTVTCEGWQGGEPLTCVASRGGVSSCSTPSGRRFTCVVEAGGVTTCADNPDGRPDANGTDCTFTGDGHFTCTPPAPKGDPLLPGPSLPSLPRTDSVITDPSVFGP